MIKMINIKKNQQNNNIDTKPPNIVNYLKSLSQEAKNLMNEIEDADEDIDIHKLTFIGSNNENFNFNIFKMPLNVILKEAELYQRDLEKKNRRSKIRL